MSVGSLPLDGQANGHVCPNGVERHERQGEKDETEELWQSSHVRHVVSPAVSLGKRSGSIRIELGIEVSDSNRDAQHRVNKLTVIRDC